MEATGTVAPLAEAFTGPWLRRLGEAINADAGYREAARTWRWPVAFVMEADAALGVPEARRAYLDLHEGACREARPATGEDLRQTPFVLRARAATWHRLLTGRLDPLVGIASRQLALDRGSPVALTRHVRGARALVAAVRRIHAEASTPAAAEAAGPDPAAPAPRGPRRFVTTQAGGIPRDSLPTRLYHKAKQLGTWDPREIDLSRDAHEWNALSDLERRVLVHLTSLFLAGEESVTGDILPLMSVIARERRIDEELYLTTFLFEEAKHTEFFRRVLDEVMASADDVATLHGPRYRRVFAELLPEAMERLRHDASPAAQIEAAVTYNMIVEGTLAETGYHAYYAMLERADILPGLRHGVGLLKRDESRHIAYGMHLVGRLLGEDPGLWPVVEERMQRMLEPALDVVHELFDTYDEMPFGLALDDFLSYAMGQFEHRFGRLQRVRDGVPLSAEAVLADLD